MFFQCFLGCCCDDSPPALLPCFKNCGTSVHYQPLVVAVILGKAIHTWWYRICTAGLHSNQCGSPKCDPSIFDPSTQRDPSPFVPGWYFEERQTNVVKPQNRFLIPGGVNQSLDRVSLKVWQSAMPCPSAGEGKRKARYSNGPAVEAYARNDDKMFQRLLKLCDAQGWSRKRGRVELDGDRSRKPGPSGLTVQIQQRIPRPADGQCGAAQR